MNRSSLVILLACLQFVFATANAKNKHREYYQITVYHFATAGQEKMLDSYLKDAYVPALHRLGNEKVGVFKLIANDTASDKLIYVMMPFKKVNEIVSLPTRLQKDNLFVQASQYFDTSYRNPPYTRMENIILQAFTLAPVMNLPKLTGPRNERVYEFRSYESPTERFYRSKVHMFNEGGETGIFSRLHFNPVFYAEVIAGCRMPNVMYMTTFENKSDRDLHWKDFSADPEWKRLSALPQYQHNISIHDIRFLRPTDYSDY